MTTSRSGADAELPSLSLLRQLTDRHVVEQLIAEPHLTRAEIAARTGISKPTISESVRRLVTSGVLAESGRQSGGRGRAGTFYRLREDVGVAMALAAGPDGMIVETYDLRGLELSRIERNVPSPADSATLNPIMRRAVTDAVDAAPGPVLAWALSLAGPVDQATGRLVRVPNAPFLLDELDPRELLSDLVDVRLQVDNDVNWAALAEYHSGSAQDLSHFCYCYLGPGLGGAVVTSGSIMHGADGLAGELAHVLTTGPGGRSLRLVDCFVEWGLLQPQSNAIDVARLTQILTGSTARDRQVRDEVATAVAGAICSITALLNPAGVVIGGPWSAVDASFVDLVADKVSTAAAIPTVVRRSALDRHAPLTGARAEAVRNAQLALLARE
jgi:predicted NBD/HSP70 family sugar kinase